MNLDNYLAYTLISFFTIISPGAAVLLAISNGMQYDMKAVTYSIIGNVLGLFLLSSVAMFGVGAALQSSETFFMILKVLGAGYLVYLGIKQIVSTNTTLEIDSQKKTTKEIAYGKIFKKGFLVAATNPKPILFFTAIFPLFMSRDHSAKSQFFIMTFTFMTISFFSLLSYGYLSSRAKEKLFSERKLSIFYKFSGSLFVLIGLGMLFIEQKVSLVKR